MEMKTEHCSVVIKMRKIVCTKLELDFEPGNEWTDAILVVEKDLKMLCAVLNYSPPFYFYFFKCCHELYLSLYFY